MKLNKNIKNKHQWAVPKVLALTVLLFVLSPILASAQGYALNKKASGPLTAKQQHYLNTLIGYAQYVSHTLVQVDVKSLENNMINLELANGVNVPLEKTSIVYRSNSDYSWFGKVPGEDYSSVNMVVHGDMVTGLFRFGGDLYEIVPLGESLHALAILDPSAFVDHNEGSYEELPSTDMTYTEQESRHDNGSVDRYVPGRIGTEDYDYRGTTDCKIRILIAYTDDVGSANADPLAGIQVAVDNYNNSNDNSAVNFDVEIARVVEVTYAESGIFSTDRNRFRNTADGFMDNIHDLRTLYDADYCQLIVQNVDEGEGCGLAYGIGVTYEDAFCASKYSCIGANLTFAHELGHLHGCRHDPYVDNSSTPYSYGHGLVNYPDRWRTVMSYNDYCTDLGSSCTRIQWWSNPNVNVSAAWGSDPSGVAGANDNETVLDVTEGTVAGWEAAVTNKSVFSADIIYAFEEGNFEGLTSLSTVASASTYLDYRNNSKGTLRAGSSITLNEGFWARAGSEVTAYLESCNVVAATGGSGNNVVSGIADDEDPQPFLAVYPNPFTNNLTVEFNLTESATVTVSLYDVLGQEVQKPFMGKNFPSGKATINLEGIGLERGVYILSIVVGEKQYTHRVVKMN